MWWFKKGKRAKNKNHDDEKDGHAINSIDYVDGMTLKTNDTVFIFHINDIECASVLINSNSQTHINCDNSNYQFFELRELRLLKDNFGHYMTLLYRDKDNPLVERRTRIDVDVNEIPKALAIERYYAEKLAGYYRFVEEENARAEELRRRAYIDQQNTSSFKMSRLLEDSYLAYEYYDVDIAGFDKTGTNVNDIKLNEFVTFVQEPDNQFDNKAVAVLYNGIGKIGYLHKGRLQEMVNDYLANRENDVFAMIYSKRIFENKVSLMLGFYKPLDEKALTKIPHFTTRLTRTTVRDEFSSRQDDIALCSEGEEIDIDYDVVSDSYLASTQHGSTIGELSSAAASKVEAFETQGYTVAARINEISENASGRLTPSLLIVALR